MKVRFAAAVALFVLGAVLPIVGLVLAGKPWGFRGHPAVLQETSGTVELQAGDVRMKHEALAEPALQVKQGMFLEAGDELRVARLSEARVKFPAAAVAVGDGTRAAVREGGMRLVTGALEVEVGRGTAPFIIEVAVPAAELRVRPAADSGLVRVFADGRNDVRVFVLRGSVEGSAAGGAVSAETGKLLVIGGDGRPVVDSPPRALSIQARCEDARLLVEAPPSTQVFALRQLSFPDNGRLSLPVPSGTGSVTVLARDVVGNVSETRQVSCAASPSPPSPPPPPRPPKPGKK